MVKTPKDRRPADPPKSGKGTLKRALAMPPAGGARKPGGATSKKASPKKAPRRG